MVKQRYNKGFTMIETVIVLVIIGILVLITPNFLINNVPLSYQMHYLKEKILMAQISALKEKQHSEVIIENNYFMINGKQENYQGMVCEDSTITFNAFGNVNHAQTITCFQDDQEQSLVIQLGSGRIDIRKR